MKRYFIISLLLILLQPLFLKNVYAEENLSIVEKNDSIEVLENITDEETYSIDDLLPLIPTTYNINLEEEEFIRNGNHFEYVEEILENEIQNVLTNNQISLEQLGYTMELLEDEEDIHHYIVIFYCEENLLHEIDVTVQFLNSSDYQEEDQEMIDEFFAEDEEIQFQQEIDFYESSEEDVVSLEDYLESQFSEADFDYYYELDQEKVSDLSYEEIGNTYFFKNHIFYKRLLTTYRVITNIHITSLVTQEDVLGEVLEKYGDSLEEEVLPSDLEITEEEEIYSPDNDYSFGELQITELSSEEEQSYSSNPTFQHSFVLDKNQDFTFQVNCMYEKFIKILVNGVEVNKKYYDVSKGGKITLKKEYLGALMENTYLLNVVYSDGVLKTNFSFQKEEIKEEPRIDNPGYQRVDIYPVYYTYYRSNPIEIETVQPEEKKEVNSVIDTVVKQKDEMKTIEIDEEEEEPEKDKNKEDKKRNVNYIPIVIVVCAFAFGTFGGYLYKKSLED